MDIIADVDFYARMSSGVLEPLIREPKRVRVYERNWVYPQQIPELPVRCPLKITIPRGMHVTGYVVGEPQLGLHNIFHLTREGYVAVVLLLLLCFPLIWVPLFMPRFVRPYQEPLYNRADVIITKPMRKDDYEAKYPFWKAHERVGTHVICAHV
eukprot:jgi/Botrbrau1/22343/Bobra.0002s0021.1